MKAKPQSKPGDPAIPLPKLHAAGQDLARCYQEFLAESAARKQAEQAARARGARLLK
jgi:hypothetical protein